MQSIITSVEYNSQLSRLVFLHELHRSCLADYEEYKKLPSTNFDLLQFAILNKELFFEIKTIIAALNTMLSDTV